MIPRHPVQIAVALTAAALVGCAHSSAPTGAAQTTTGILPSGVPTEGTRPAAEMLSPAAEPGIAPPPSTTLPGRMVRVGARPEGITVDDVTRTVVVAIREPDQLVLLNADTAGISGRIPLPGSVRHLELATQGSQVLVPVESANALVRLDLPQGVVSPPIVTGTSPHDAAAASNGAVFVGNELGGTVSVLRGSQIVKVFTDSVQPAGMAAVGTAVGMLDARKNSLTVYDADKLSIVGSTPGGAGPTHLVADRHGRMIATDTRGNVIRVFDPLPTPREVGNVSQSGAPYGIAYDHARDRLWVASSGANEVVCYSMAESTPREIARIATVQNPYSLAVDSLTGRLFIAGVTGGLLQIIDPA